MKKLLKILIGSILLLLIIATLIDSSYLMFFLGGAFFSILFAILYRSQKLTFQESNTAASIVSSIAVFALWIVAIPEFLAGLGILLSIIGGTISPSIASTAYLHYED